MTKKPAFSLMEVMVILLIMAVTLAATAPMITKKMSRNVGNAEEPWKYSGVNQSVSYKASRNNATILIRTDRIGSRGRRVAVSSREHPSLYIRQRMANVTKVVSDMTRLRDRGLHEGHEYEGFIGATINYTAPIGITFAGDGFFKDKTKVFNRVLGYIGVQDSAARDRIGQLIFGTNASPGFNKTYLGTSFSVDNVDTDYANDFGASVFDAQNNRRVFNNISANDNRVILTVDGFLAGSPVRELTSVGSVVNNATMHNIVTLGHCINLLHGDGPTLYSANIPDHNRTDDSVFIGMNQRSAWATRWQPDWQNVQHGPVNPGVQQQLRVYDATNITAIGNRFYVYGQGVTAIGDRVVGGRAGCLPLEDNSRTYHSSPNSTAIGTLAVTGGEGSVSVGARSMAGRSNHEDNVNNGDHHAVAIGNCSRATRSGAIHIGASSDGNNRTTVRYSGVDIDATIYTNSNGRAADGCLIRDNTRDPALGAHANNAIQIGFSDNQHLVLSQNAILIGRGNIPASRANSVAIGTDAVPAANQIMLGSDGLNGRVTAPTVVIPGLLSVNIIDLSRAAKSSIANDAKIRPLLSLYTPTVPSDIRLKNVGEKFTSGLEDINKLEFFNYTYKNDKEKKPHVGVMAQELQKIFPISVSEGSDGYLRIRTDEMFYAALNAIKELNQKIIALAGEVKEFFSRVDKLDIRVAQNQTALDKLKSESAQIDERLARLEEE